MGGTAGGYSSRYFFDEAIEDYYQVPKRIKTVTKPAIVDIAQSLFTDNIWGLGVLSNCDKAFAHELRNQVEPLWQTDKKG